MFSVLCLVLFSPIFSIDSSSFFLDLSQSGSYSLKSFYCSTATTSVSMMWAVLKMSNLVYNPTLETITQSNILSFSRIHPIIVKFIQANKSVIDANAYLKVS
jgi:hypothetical protein